MRGEGLVLEIDPHVHSEGSYDGREPVELILEHASDIGLDGVVITDHDTIDESLHAAEIASEFDLVGIPGVEVSTAAGHLLAIGVEECPPRRRPLAETVDVVREQGGIAVVPHPFQRSRHGIRKRRIRNCDYDGIEVYNSMLFTGYRNRRARRYAESQGYPKLGASDAHSIRNVGRAYTEIRLPTVDGSRTPADIDGEEVIDAIRAGETDLRGRRTPIHRSTRQYAKGSMKKSAFLLTTMMPYIKPRPASLREY